MRSVRLRHKGTDLAQNIYDVPEFFEGYSWLDRSIRGLEGAPEWAAVRAVLPDVKGKRVVDLGCGFGWFARWASAQGASSVLGLDLSENMLARAKAETIDRAVRYEITDLEKLELPEGAFELAYSSLTFHYIEDFSKLARTVFQALVPGAHLVFTVEHPIYMAPRHPSWIVGEDGQKAWPVSQYALEGKRVTDWLIEGVVKQHRRVGTTLNILIDAGFTIRHVEEWCPTAEQIVAQPVLIGELERPILLLVVVQR